MINVILASKGSKTFFAAVVVVFTFLLSSCDNSPQEEVKKELLVYCGITMANPIKEIARNFEKQHGVKITITQGGSEDLYQSLKSTQKGDLYLPGSFSYRKKHLDEGLLLDFVNLGYNQAAILVAKGNPKNIQAKLEDLLRKDVLLVIGSPESGSIGRETKNILEKQKLYSQALNSAVYLTSDSRTLNHALKKGEADVIINWKATAFFTNNKDVIEAIALPQDVAKPKLLAMNLISFSKYPDLAKQFMSYAASEQGNQIFKKYGFLIPSDVK